MVKNNELVGYYAKRALEYENIYLKSERQKYIKESKALLKKYFENKNVLEIACGTGFWTETISEVSNCIMAVDLNNEVLEIARNKKYNCKVNFIQDDSYELKKINGKYDSLFAGFWFSHIPKSRIRLFLNTVNNKITENGILVFMDNIYVEGNNTPISKYDNEGNSYQIRKLNDNSEYEILKNFYEENELKNCIKDNGKEIIFNDLKYYWIIKYVKVNSPNCI